VRGIAFSKGFVLESSTFDRQLGYFVNFISLKILKIRNILLKSKSAHVNRVMQLIKNTVNNDKIGKMKTLKKKQSS
jgi:hypothetical protein